MVEDLSSQEGNAEKLTRSKIPPLRQGEEASVVSKDSYEAHLLQKLRTQISPSRIPHAVLPTVAEQSHTCSKTLKPGATKQRTVDGTKHTLNGSSANKEEQQRQTCKAARPHLRNRRAPGQLSSTQHDASASRERQPWRTPQQQQLKEQAQQTQQQLLSRLWQTQPAQTQQTRHHSLSHSSLHSTACTPGWAASQKLHEFLLHQQHKREQYWLSKYGKLLGAAGPQTLQSKPCRNPASLFRHPVAAHNSSKATADAISRSSSSPLRLPVLPGSDGESSKVTDSTDHGSSTHPSSIKSSAHKHVNVQLSGGCSSGSGAESTAGSAVMSCSLPSIRGSTCDVGSAAVDGISRRSLCGDGIQEDAEEDAAFERLKAKITLASVPKLSVATCLSAAAGSMAAVATSCGTTSRAGLKHPSRLLPCRDLESELQVLRAIHAREDALDKLKACCSKIGATWSAGDSSTWLLPSDPLGRLFYRLIAHYRAKTLEVIEAHAAWQRKVAAQEEPYFYKGKPYLLTMGEGLGFLDSAPWLRGRLVHCKAVQDVLLAGITPDGVPVDDVTPYDMKTGPSHFSPEALRVHLARKVLAAAGAQLPPNVSHSLAAAVLQQQHEEQQQASSSVHVCHQHAAQSDTQCHSAHNTAVAAAAAAAALAILSARGSPSRQDVRPNNTSQRGASDVSQLVSFAGQTDDSNLTVPVPVVSQHEEHELQQQSAAQQEQQEHCGNAAPMSAVSDGIGVECKDTAGMNSCSKRQQQGQDPPSLEICRGLGCQLQQQQHTHQQGQLQLQSEQQLQQLEQSQEQQLGQYQELKQQQQQPGAEEVMPADQLVSTLQGWLLQEQLQAGVNGTQKATVESAYETASTSVNASVSGIVKVSTNEQQEQDVLLQQQSELVHQPQQQQQGLQQSAEAITSSVSGEIEGILDCLVTDIQTDVCQHAQGQLQHQQDVAAVQACDCSSDQDTDWVIDGILDMLVAEVEHNKCSSCSSNPNQ